MKKSISLTSDNVYTDVVFLPIILMMMIPFIILILYLLYTAGHPLKAALGIWLAPIAIYYYIRFRVRLSTAKIKDGKLIINQILGKRHTYNFENIHDITTSLYQTTSSSSIIKAYSYIVTLEMKGANNKIKEFYIVEDELVTKRFKGRRLQDMLWELKETGQIGGVYTTPSPQTVSAKTDKQ